MDFKKCNNCGCLCQASIEKCPECGNQISEQIQTINNSTINRNNENEEPGGSVVVGFFLGFFLGMLGFLISLISRRKENGKTIMGVLYGVLVNTVLTALIYFILLTL